MSVARTSVVEIMGLAVVGWLASLVHGPAGVALARPGNSSAAQLLFGLAYLASGLVVAGAVLALVALAWRMLRPARFPSSEPELESRGTRATPAGLGEPAPVSDQSSPPRAPVTDDWDPDFADAPYDGRDPFADESATGR